MTQEQELNPPNFSADLAKRLAEAADGYRDGKFYCFVCKNAFPYDIRVASGNTAEQAISNANDELATLDPTQYHIYGPYQTSQEEDYNPTLVYDAIEIKFLNQNSVVQTQTLDGNTDCIVFDLSAYDKFFHTYFVRLYGHAQANDLRTSAKAQLSLSKPVIHAHATLLNVSLPQ